MNKYKFMGCILAASVTLGGALSSCTDGFEEMNTNGLQVDPNTLPFSAQCMEPMQYCYPPQQNMFQFWTNLTTDLYGGYFMTPHSNFTNADLGDNQGHSGGMYENFYLHIFNNTRRIIANCEAKNWNGIAGIMKVVQAYGLLMTTDAYGPLAYTSVLEGKSESEYGYDSQQKLYEIMLTDLKQATDDIAKMDDEQKATLAGFDQWNTNGDVDLWVKTANTLRLRIALRLSKRQTEMNQDGYDLPAIAREVAGNTLANGGKDIMIDKQLENEMWLMFNWGDCGFNANLVTIMSGFKDPRQPLYMTKNTGDITNEKGDQVVVAKNTEYIGIRQASGVPAKGAAQAWANRSGWIQGNNGSSFSMPLPIMKQAEAYFLLAEAKLRGWITDSRSVQQLYEEGIRVSMTNELAYRGSYAGVTAYADNAIDNYINGTTTQIDFVDPTRASLSTAAVNKLSVKWDEGATNEQKLERIITQKWLANFPLSNEAWAEWRRTGYPHFFQGVVNKSNGGIDLADGVRRVIYGSTPADTNPVGYAQGMELLKKEDTHKSSIDMNHNNGNIGGVHLWWDNANKGNF